MRYYSRELALWEQTRKNATGVPPELIALKERNTPLLYGGNQHIVGGDASLLCLAGQQYCRWVLLRPSLSLWDPHNWVWRKSSKTPRLVHQRRTSLDPYLAMNHVKSSPFQSQYKPTMTTWVGIDHANHLRRNFNCHRQFELRNWRPIAYWLFDVCSTNAFVIWKSIPVRETTQGSSSS